MENVLLVDDEKNVRAAIRRLLHKDFQIYTAAEAGEGIRLLQEHETAVVISDYRMPGRNGVDFLEQVRQCSPATIRILLTGQRDEHIAIDAINSGHVYRFIYKPWQNDELLLTVEQALELYQLHRERRHLIQELQQKSTALTELNAHLEQKVEERTRQVLQADKMASLGQMAGQIGHEIKNVLAILKGRVQLLQLQMSGTTGGKKTYQESLKEMDKTVNRLASFATNLQSLGKARNVQLELVNVSEVLRKTVRALNEIGLLKYYTVREEYPAEPVLAMADAGQLDQVYTNLLINAHHAMGQKGCLDIRVSAAPDGNSLAVTVADTGCGIAPENLERLFEPFFTTKPDGKGTGLGLAVVKQIIDDHGGSIAVQSKIAEGTAITIILPRGRSDTPGNADVEAIACGTDAGCRPPGICV